MLRRVRHPARRRPFGAIIGVAAAILCAVVSLLVACGGSGGSAVPERANRDAQAPQRTTVAAGVSAETPQQPTARADDGGVRSRVGFRTRRQLQEHFAKHGAEFGRITRQEYLRAAQKLRDAPVGGNVEEIRRADGTVSRFDRSSGAFIAFDADGTIRTFFKPNAGESYFRRQATRAH
jgi:hypothetical protein